MNNLRGVHSIFIVHLGHDASSNSAFNRGGGTPSRFDNSREGFLIVWCRWMANNRNKSSWDRINQGMLSKQKTPIPHLRMILLIRLQDNRRTSRRTWKPDRRRTASPVPSCNCSASIYMVSSRHTANRSSSEPRSKDKRRTDSPCAYCVLCSKPSRG